MNIMYSLTALTANTIFKPERSLAITTTLQVVSLWLLDFPLSCGTEMLLNQQHPQAANNTGDVGGSTECEKSPAP